MKSMMLITSIRMYIYVFLTPLYKQTRANCNEIFR